MSNFILYKRQPDEAIRAHSKVTDELMLAVLDWSVSVEKKVMVYSYGWIKSVDMWEEIQKASWDEVLMNSEEKMAIREDVEGFFLRESVYKDLLVPWKVCLGVPNLKSQSLI
jgi:transitional endoplasmic reticulum ATPase